MSVAEVINFRRTYTTEDSRLDVKRVREDFPILRRKVRNKPLVYLDNAASTQKPQCVIDAISRFYSEDYANIHRGVHYLSQTATDQFEAVRKKVQRFINAPSEREIIFVRGATEGINLVSNTYGRVNVGPGDEIVISAMEHHSNIVPWQILCQEKGAKLRVIPIHDDGSLDLDNFESMLTERTKLVGLVHVSNALGTVNPIKHLTALAHERGIPVLVDGAQSVPHMAVDVQDLDCDFFVFSGHKLYGPSGIGVIFGKERLLKDMPPYQGGGDMITSVTFEKTTYNEIPYKFEAGTPAIADVIGLGAAVDYLTMLGMDHIEAHERRLLEYGTRQLEAIEGVRLIGTAPEKAGVLSFVMEGTHPHDVGTILDQYGVAIRTGHHCAQPVMDRFGLPATARASLGIYNTEAEIDALVESLAEVKKVFG